MLILIESMAPNTHPPVLQGYKEDKDMKSNRRIKDKAVAFIRHEEELAEQGFRSDNAPVGLLAAQREVELVDRILPQITPEEWKRINAGYPGLPRDMMDCKDIKDKYGLSWNELRGLWGMHYKPTLHYKIDIMKTLEAKGHTWSSLKKRKLIGQGTLVKLGRGELVSLKSLEVICGLLNMQPGELIEYR